MGILLELVRRLNVDVGTVFTASVSRTAECESPVAEGQRKTSFLDGSASLTRKNPTNMLSGQGHPPEMASAPRSIEFTEGDLMQPPNTRVGSDEATTTLTEPNMFERIDPKPSSVNYGFNEMLSNMSFDFDPLFGFNDFQMEFEVEL
jgi:hypothetical protein